MTAYDEVAYVSRPFRQTHPDRMATMAAIFGIPAADPSRARVLDVGCGSGGNIIPLAAALPHASFFGFDLAPTAIELAQVRAAAVGVINLRLETLDLMDFPEDAGEFDYIIAHGFYSWIPEPVRERFWKFLERHLSANGVAYVSFNAYPGAMFRHIWRDAAAFHAGGIENIQERVAQSVQMLNLMTAAHVKRGPFDKILEEMTTAIRTKGMNWVSHDDFGPFFQPFYFHQVAEEAGKHGLYYLSDSGYYDMQPHEITPGALPILEQLGRTSGILREQYYDFLEMRAFRQVLFCRSGSQEQRAPVMESIRTLHFSSSTQITGATSDGLLAVRNPLTQMSGAVPAAYRQILDQLLKAWPGSVHFGEIAPYSLDREKVAAMVHTLWSSALLEAHATPMRCGTGKEQKPVAWKVARVEAAANEPVTSRLHTQVQLDEISNKLVQALDGTRNRAQLALEFAELEGRLKWLADMGLLDPASAAHS